MTKSFSKHPFSPHYLCKPTYLSFSSNNYRNTISAIKSLYIFRSWLNLLANIQKYENQIIGLIVDPYHNNNDQ